MACRGDTRREIMFGASLLAAAPILSLTSPARAAGGTAPAAVKYRLKPNGAAQCDKCVYYIPAATAAAPGQCKVVAGAISPSAWCVLFAPKPH